MRFASRPLLARLTTLDRLIRSSAFPNATGLSRELEVSVRTVYRDLAFLRDTWGAPLKFCPQRNGFFYREPSYRLPTQGLSEGELVALLLAARLLEQYRATPF